MLITADVISNMDVSQPRIEWKQRLPVETWDLPVAGSPTVEMAMPVIYFQNIQSAPNFAAHEPSRYFIKMQFKRRGRTKVESTEGDEKLKRA